MTGTILNDSEHEEIQKTDYTSLFHSKASDTLTKAG